MKNSPTQRQITIVKPKSLWQDWIFPLLQCFLTPIVVLLLTFIYSGWYGHIQEETNKAQHDRDINIAEQQQRATVLATYIHDINDLTFTQGLTTSSSGDTVRIVARAETLTALRQLSQDGQRKGSMLQFLIEMHLITDSHVVVSLSEADLGKVFLTWAPLPGADFRYADLSKSDLRYSILKGANFLEATLNNARLDRVDLSLSMLRGTDLGGAHLEYANLSGADLSGAFLAGADLKGAQVTKKQLNQAKSCKNMILPNGKVHPLATCKI